MEASDVWQFLNGVTSRWAALAGLIGLLARLWHTGTLGRLYRGILTLGVSKWDRDLILTQLGINPADPAARRLALTEINRLQRREASRDDSPPGSTGWSERMPPRRRSSDGPSKTEDSTT